jgi:hypothetical protein
MGRKLLTSQTRSQQPCLRYACAGPPRLKRTALDRIDVLVHGSCAQVAVSVDSRVTRVSNDRVQTQPGQVRQKILQDDELARDAPFPGPIPTKAHTGACISSNSCRAARWPPEGHETRRSVWPGAVGTTRGARRRIGRAHRVDEAAQDGRAETYGYDGGSCFRGVPSSRSAASDRPIRDAPHAQARKLAQRRRVPAVRARSRVPRSLHRIHR